MTPLDKLKVITNFSEKEVNTQNLQVHYLDMISSDDEENLRKIKQKNRELAVDAILEGKIEEYQNGKDSLLSELRTDGDYTTISMKVFSMNVNSTSYNTDDDIYKAVISFLDQNTKSKKTTAVSFNSNTKGPNKPLDVKLTGDLEQDRRRVTTKIMMSSNIIAMNGRIGPGTSVIVGKNVYQYLDEYFGGLKVILDDTIDPDKVIVCRSSTQDQNGLILIKDEKNKNFYFRGTPRWDRQYCWFHVK